MKKIIVFGATGRTGKLVVEQALQAGYQVTVVIRQPDAFAVRHQNLAIIKGDIFQPATFENAFSGKDAVVSCLGSKATQRTTVYSQGVSNIATGMLKAGLNRIICISAGAVIVPSKSSLIMQFVIRNILQRILKHMYSDMLVMERLLSESSLNWTVIRPPRLTNSKYTGKYRSTINEHLNNPSKISRADLADYIVGHLTDEKTFSCIVEISY